MNSYPMMASPCSKCGYRADVATGAGRAVVAGDFALCFNCGALGRFDEELVIRPVTSAGVFDLAMDQPESLAQLEQVQAAIRRRGLMRPRADLANEESIGAPPEGKMGPPVRDTFGPE